MSAWRDSFTLDSEGILYEFINEDETIVRVRKGVRGNLGTDILVTIQDKRVNDTKEKSIRHIYWVVDALLKREKEPLLTEEFLNKFVSSWTALETFKSNNKKDIEEWINKYLADIDLTEYESLNQYGFLSIKTLYQILMLLSGNEKSSRSDAFMFRTIITRIAEGDADLYDVVAWADCNKSDIKWGNRR